jgi:tetratricopeptide (TPR) repeat protein
LLTGILLFGGVPATHACLWDSDTLLEERLTNPKMAAAVLDAPPKPDVRRLRARIEALRAAPRENDPAWWNDLAGAHLRLGETATAVELLEPAVRRFPDDYGVHANLGTAYHLLKRYAEAEREIARDLELNPEAHSGLERYHLALLQYLVRDKTYQARHVYVDEWTESFFTSSVPRLEPPQKQLSAAAKNSYQPEPRYDGSSPPTLAQELARATEELKAIREKPADKPDGTEARLELLQALSDHPPAYRSRWDLASDPKFAEGVIYMASLNREEPACWVMLGIASVDHSDLNLAAAAFRRAIELGSPQAPLLESHLTQIRQHQRESGPSKSSLIGLGLTVLALPLLLGGGIVFWVRRRIRRRKAALPTRPTVTGPGYSNEGP